MLTFLFLTNTIIKLYIIALILDFLFHPVTFTRYEITVEQTFQISNNLYFLLIRQSISVSPKVDVLNETLLNIFRNNIPNKKVQCHYPQTP